MKLRNPKDKELVAKLISDPVFFCRAALGFTPHRAQVEVLTSPLERMRVMLPWGRQIGKSRILGAYACWKTFSEKNYSVFIFNPSGKQSENFLRNYVLLPFTQSPLLKRLVKTRQKGNTFFVGGDEWGSQVEYIEVGLKAENARGRTVRGRGLVIFDELSSFMYPAEVTQTIEPFLNSQGGGEVFLSSPGEPDSFMHSVYLDFKAMEEQQRQANKPLRHRVFEATIYDCDWMDKQWIDEQRRTLVNQGREWFFNREYLGEWVHGEGMFFDADDVKACELKTPINQGTRDDTWIYSLDPGMSKSPACLLIARWNGKERRLEIVECLLLVRDTNTHVKKEMGAEKVEGYLDLIETILNHRAARPITTFYIDPGIEQTMGETLLNTHKINVVECRVSSNKQKLTALNDLKRSLETQKIVWTDKRISRQLIEFAPKQKENGQYEFPNSNYDIIAALTQLNRYLGERTETPFFAYTRKQVSN